MATKSPSIIPLAKATKMAAIPVTSVFTFVKSPNQVARDLPLVCPKATKMTAISVISVFTLVRSPYQTATVLLHSSGSHLATS